MAQGKDSVRHFALKSYVARRNRWKTREAQDQFLIWHGSARSAQRHPHGIVSEAQITRCEHGHQNSSLKSFWTTEVLPRTSFSY
jgi:hypothetical protein